MAWTSFNESAKTFRMRPQNADDYGRIHPTQKPVALYKWLLKNYAKPNDKIFDSHVGSGSSRIACYDMGFDFMGCELDEDYWKAQEERFKSHTSQIDLFAPTELQPMMIGGSL
jgi:site-specific DNA-methyltransferase (adenine-specific)